MHLSCEFGQAFTPLYFTSKPALPAGLLDLASDAPLGVRLCVVAPSHAEGPSQARIDTNGQAWSRFDARDGTLYLIRPDGYVLARWREPRWADVRRVLQLCQAEG